MRLLLIILTLMVSGEMEYLSASPPQEDAMKAIVDCLRKGDSKKLSGYFTNTVDIGLPEKDNSYSLAQGELVMKEFFRKFPPSSYTSDQQDSPSGTSCYAIGTYTSGNQKFKTLIYIKKEINTWKIHKLKFEEIKS